MPAERDDAPEEELWPLPEGWTWAKISDATQPALNIDPRKLATSEFTYIDLGAIDRGQIVSPQIIPVAKAPSRAKQLVEQGDTLFSCVRVYLKNITYVATEYHAAVASTAYCVLRPQQGIDSRYLFWYVNWQKFTSWAIPLQRGNSPPAVVDGDVKRLPFPIPPIPEQRRIVARIDELLAEIAEGEAALERARSGLDTWRRALLKAAVTGGLTRDWRSVNAMNEDDQRYAGQSLQVEKTSLQPLPQGWRWIPLSELIFDTLIGLNRNLEKQQAGADGASYIKMNNITTEGAVVLTNLVRVKATLNERVRFGVKDGDVLFNTRNSLELVGKTGLIEGAHAGTVFNNNIMRIRFRPIIDPAFACYQMCSPPFRGQLDKIKKATTSVAAIYQRDLLSLVMAVPPIDEQCEIVRLIQSQVADASIYEGDLKNDLARLRQSILKSAFEGRLVPQDPADEPASVLLARLRAESPAPPPRTRGRKPTR
jgi:type I restriction enzyme, S subunit